MIESFVIHDSKSAKYLSNGGQNNFYQDLTDNAMWAHQYRTLQLCEKQLCMFMRESDKRKKKLNLVPVRLINPAIDVLEQPDYVKKVVTGYTVALKRRSGEIDYHMVTQPTDQYIERSGIMACFGEKGKRSIKVWKTEAGARRRFEFFMEAGRNRTPGLLKVVEYTE